MTLISLFPPPFRRWLRSRFPFAYARARDRYIAYRYWQVEFFRAHPLLAAIPRCIGITVDMVLLPLRCSLFLFAMMPVRQRTVRAEDTSPARDIVMLAVSHVAQDPRVQRSALALAAGGYRVKVLYPDFNGSSWASPIDWGPGIEFLPLPGGVGKYAFRYPYLFGVSYLRAASRLAPFAFHSHDLDTSLIALAAARISGALCVCDFHEWYSENAGWNAITQRYAPHPWYRRALFRQAERIVMKRADAVITVCDSIARELGESFPRGKGAVRVIRNIPYTKLRPTRTYRPLREELGLPADRFILLWQGGIGPSRLLEPVIESLKHAPDVVLVIRGPWLDHYGDTYRKLASDLGVSDRLLLLPPVPSRDVVAAAVGADAGIWTLPNLSKNFYYALPNKIFEYLAAGLPTLVADFPEARRLVVENGIGLSFDPYDPRSIAAQVNRLARDPQLADDMRRAISGVMDKLDAGQEWSKLVALYDEVALSPSRATYVRPVAP